MTKQLNKTSSFFKHIAKGRNANNTFAKSLKCSLFSKTSFVTFFIFQFITSTTHAQIQQPKIPQTETFKTVNVNPNNEITNNKPIQKTQNVYQQQNKQAEQRQQLDLIKHELNRSKQQAKQKPILIDTNKYNGYKVVFEKTLAQLKGLASNPNSSLADAFYITENAFGNNYLTKKEYENILNKSVAFIKQWMKENNYNPNDNEAKHLAIQKFMSEKLMITKVTGNVEFGTSIKTTQHVPFFYDYIDYSAEKDHRNLFVTKALATGGGQCNSLPIVYLLLAEKLNAPTYLTFAPQHSFIKYKKNDGEIENYEPTSNWHINDLWYQENSFISPQAIKSGLYLDTLSKQKIIANCILDLAIQYIRKMPIDDGKFLKDCLREAQIYFPTDNNILAYSVYISYLKGMLTRYISYQNITDLNKLKNDKYAINLQEEYQLAQEYFKSLGYQEMPEGMYEKMLNEHELKGKIQKRYDITGKQKRNLFIEPK